MSNHPLIDQFHFPVLQELGISKNEKLIIAGPCAVENLEQMTQIAEMLKHHHISFLRAGSFKPRTSPYDFQGLEKEALEILKYIKDTYQLKIVSEIPSIQYLDDFADAVDIFQIGARNMQNFSLLKDLSTTNKPLLLKRGFGNTLEEWLCAAEYLLLGGNQNVILCERGIRTFENATRSTLDLGSVALIKNTYQIPVIVDPSHASGRSDIVTPLSLASLEAGADGLIIEVHPNPNIALSDRTQALTFEQFQTLYSKITTKYNTKE